MGSPTESIILATAPKFTAFLSLCGSTCVMTKVLRSPKRRAQTMHRIMLGMSTSNICSSIWYFAGTWVIPRGTPSWFGDGTQPVFWAVGTDVTCSVGGFFNQFAVANPLFNATLAAYFLLTVNYGWDDRRLRNVEWLFHTIPFGYAIITSTFAAAANLYGSVEWTCWILPDEVFDDTKDPTNIQSRFQMIQWMFLFGVVWVCIAFVSIIFIILYRKMKVLERKMRRYSVVSAISMASSADRGAYASRTSYISRRDSNVSRASSTSKPQVERKGVASSLPATESGIYRKEDTKSEESPRKEDEEIDDREGAIEPPIPESDVEQGISGGQADGRRLLQDTEADQEIVAAHDENANAREGSKTGEAKFSLSIAASKAATAVRRRGSVISNSTQKDSNSRKIAVQGMLYVVAFYITWLFPTISRIAELSSGKHYFAIQFLDTFLVPLQGFFNCGIYLRPRFMGYRRANPDAGFWTALKAVIIEDTS